MVRNPALPIVLALTLGWSIPPLASAKEAIASINPCTMLTEADVSAVLGKTVEPGRPLDNGLTEDGAYSSTCLWVAPLETGVQPDNTKALGGRNFAILNVMNWAGGPTDARKFLDGFMKAFDEHEIPSKPVTVNVGADDAIWWGDGVAARKDGVSFGISVVHAGDTADRKPKAEALAKQIVRWLQEKPA
jgi:hypothetical protein